MESRFILSFHGAHFDHMRLSLRVFACGPLGLGLGLELGLQRFLNVKAVEALGGFAVLEKGAARLLDSSFKMRNVRLTF